MARSKSLNIASIMILVIGLTLVAVGVIYSSKGTLMPYHEKFIGMTPSQIRAFNPRLMDFVGGSISLLGFLFISLGIANIGLCIASLRKGERWSWITIVSTDAFTFIPLTYVTYVVGGFDIPFPIMFSALILWVAAMCLSAKEALTPK